MLMLICPVNLLFFKTQLYYFYLETDTTEVKGIKTVFVLE